MDNVLLEYGLFAGELGEENVIFICKGNPKIATDLKGITHLDLKDGNDTLK
ncbi:TIR domain-containing protein [Clostridium perfringens]|uniref:TIR domain-containing protein n=1 Tax=Clostridium perfringens TaxID=1502 RepID=UPI003DA41D3F